MPYGDTSTKLAMSRRGLDGQHGGHLTLCVPTQEEPWSWNLSESIPPIAAEYLPLLNEQFYALCWLCHTQRAFSVWLVGVASSLLLKSEDPRIGSCDCVVASASADTTEDRNEQQQAFAHNFASLNSPLPPHSLLDPSHRPHCKLFTTPRTSSAVPSAPATASPLL